MEIKEEKRWIVLEDDKECKSKEEALLYIKTIKSKKELIKYLNYEDYTDDDIDRFIATIQNIPFYVAEYIKSFENFYKEIKTNNIPKEL